MNLCAEESPRAASIKHTAFFGICDASKHCQLINLSRPSFTTTSVVENPLSGKNLPGHQCIFSSCLVMSIETKVHNLNGDAFVLLHPFSRPPGSSGGFWFFRAAPSKYPTIVPNNPKTGAICSLSYADDARASEMTMMSVTVRLRIISSALLLDDERRRYCNVTMYTPNRSTHRDRVTSCHARRAVALMASVVDCLGGGIGSADAALVTRAIVESAPTALPMLALTQVEEVPNGSLKGAFISH
ncbi:hypothetical protein [Burkholderia stabilis]|uniref:hypothetical protein n=1 Tax=Burkholderia stabilis TaxID=95485 RepID=UPI0010118CD6|nr:hypothetical protein [Burkholderia stabilis]